MCVYGGIVVFGLLLKRVVRRLRNGKEEQLLELSAVLIIAIPFWLNTIIYNEYYRVIPLESTLTPEEWMAFLGSYFSVAGTVIIGALAYWQTEVNRSQDKEIDRQKGEIEELRNKIAAYQVKPTLHFKKGFISAYTEKQNRYGNIDLYKNLYFMLYDEECHEEEASFIHIVIPYKEKNIVPIEEIRILELIWKVDLMKYVVDVSEKKYVIVGNKLHILLDRTAKIKDDNKEKRTGHDLIQHMACHQSFYSNGKAGFENSQLEMKLSIINQLKESREYDLRYQIHSEYKGRKLSLKEPYIKIRDGKDEITHIERGEFDDGGEYSD